jgi:hypothetical protein
MKNSLFQEVADCFHVSMANIINGKEHPRKISTRCRVEPDSWSLDLSSRMLRGVHPDKSGGGKGRSFIIIDVK